MAFDRTTAIVSDLAGRVLASSLGSIASCAGGTADRLAWSRRPTIHVAATRATNGPGPETRGQVARRKLSLDDQRGGRSEGSLPSGADHRATPLYSVGPQGPDHDAVMRIGGEAPGRRAHSQKRCQHHGLLRVTATSDRHRRPTIFCSPGSESLSCPRSPFTPLAAVVHGSAGRLVLRAEWGRTAPLV